jgi:hypothetical protein
MAKKLASGREDFPGVHVSPARFEGVRKRHINADLAEADRQGPHYSTRTWTFSLCAS